jgi:hypothetical protein
MGAHIRRIVATTLGKSGDTSAYHLFHSIIQKT